MKKVVLLFDIDPLTSRKGFENIGLGYIASVLRAQGFNVILEKIWSKYCNTESLAKIVNKYDESEVLVAGVSLFNTNIEYANILLNQLSKRHRNVVKVVGGTYATVCGEELLKKFPIFDILIMGEGEETFAEICKLYSSQDIGVMTEDKLSKIDGIIYKSLNGINKTKARRQIKNLDSLPLPARDILLEQPKEEPDDFLYTSINTSRGCIGNCTFCCVNANSKVQNGDIWRGRSISNVVDEIEGLIKDHNLMGFCIMDSSIEDPSCDKKRLNDLCDEILKRKIKAFFRIETRADSYHKTDTNLIKKLYDCGMRFAIIGVESGSKEMLDVYGKRATVSDNERCITLFEDNGIFVQPGFIMFNPYVDFNNLIESVEFLSKIKKAYRMEWLTSKLSVYYNSEMWHKLVSDNLIIDTNNIVSESNYRYMTKGIDSIVEQMSSFRNNPIDKEFKRSDYLSNIISIFYKNDFKKESEIQENYLRLNSIRNKMNQYNTDLFLTVIENKINGKGDCVKYEVDETILEELKKINKFYVDLIGLI